MSRLMNGGIMAASSSLMPVSDNRSFADRVFCDLEHHHCGLRREATSVADVQSID